MSAFSSPTEEAQVKFLRFPIMWDHTGMTPTMNQEITISPGSKLACPFNIEHFRLQAMKNKLFLFITYSVSQWNFVWESEPMTTKAHAACCAMSNNIFCLWTRNLLYSTSTYLYTTTKSYIIWGKIRFITLQNFDA